MEYWFENETSANSNYQATSGTELTFDLPHEAEYYVWIRGYNAGGPGRPTASVAVSTRLGELAALQLRNDRAANRYVAQLKYLKSI